MDKPQKTEQELLNFYANCYIKFTEAVLKLGDVRINYEIAGKSVCLVFAGGKMVNEITASLDHHRKTDATKADLTIYIWDTESSSVEIPDAPCDRYSFTYRGDIKGFNSSRIKTAYQWSEDSLSIIDLYTNTAIFWIKSYKNLPASVLSAPFHTLFYWWFEKLHWVLFPASAVVTDEGIILIPEKSSIENTLITLSDFESERSLQYIDYNYYIVHTNPSNKVFKLYNNLFVDSDTNIRFKNNIQLKAIIINERNSDASTNIEYLSKINALRKISFLLMSDLPYSGFDSYQLIAKLLNVIPVYKLNIGLDKNQLNKALYDLIIYPEKSINQKTEIKKCQEPFISLIIPVYNGERFIREVIENLISQKYSHHEIIIIDGSTDKTEEIIVSIKGNIRYFRQENQGPAAARNLGIREACGDYIIFLDVDDLFPENNMHVLMDEMVQDTELDVVHGYAQLLEENQKNGKFEYTGNPKESYPYYICAGIYRKSVFDKVGLFDSTLKCSEDTDWFLRAIEMNCKIKRIEEVTLYVRRHSNNLTKDKNLNELQVPLVLKRKIDRMRKKCLK